MQSGEQHITKHRLKSRVGQSLPPWAKIGSMTKLGEDLQETTPKISQDFAQSYYFKIDYSIFARFHYYKEQKNRIVWCC